MICRKRSDFYFTVSDDERRALASVQRVEQAIALKRTKRRRA
ncbi:MAG TPA: hypothetical protein VFF30_11685 [Nitrososphaerales archaeon]|nr:hypothetical protein [Nitrososphaerales archaeon]